MSILSIDRLSRDVMRDVALRKRLQENPQGELARYPHPLTETERSLLLAGDVGALYSLGANTFLMGYLARYRVFGLDPAVYGERMRAAGEAK
jgi:hypothetical protein